MRVFGAGLAGEDVDYEVFGSRGGARFLRKVVCLGFFVDGFGWLVGGCRGVQLSRGRRVDRELVGQGTLRNKRLRRLAALSQRQKRGRMILPTHRQLQTTQQEPPRLRRAASTPSITSSETHLDLPEKVNPAMPLKRMQHRPPLRKRQRRRRRPHEDGPRREDAQGSAPC